VAVVVVVVNSITVAVVVDVTVVVVGDTRVTVAVVVVVNVAVGVVERPWAPTYSTAQLAEKLPLAAATPNT